MGVAVAVAQSHVNVQVRVALRVVADNAGAACQLNRSCQMQDLAIAVARLPVGQFHGVAVRHAVKTANCAEDHAAVDAAAAAGLLQPMQHVRPRPQPDGYHS